MRWCSLICMSELRAPCPTRRTIWVATEMTATTKNQFARIDVHSHVIPAELLQAIEKRPERFQMQVDRKAGKLVRESAGALPLFEEFWDAKAKVDGMARKGIDGSCISPAPFVLFYWLDVDAALEGSRIVNDGIAAMAAAFPDRLLGMGTL